MSTLIPRQNWLRCGEDRSLLVFICPTCRMFSTVYNHVKVSKSGLTDQVRCVHGVSGCEFEGRLKLEDWQAKNSELYGTKV